MLAQDSDGLINNEPLPQYRLSWDVDPLPFGSDFHFRRYSPTASDQSSTFPIPLSFHVGDVQLGEVLIQVMGTSKFNC